MKQTIQFKRTIHKLGGSTVAVIPSALIKMAGIEPTDKIVWIIRGKKIEVKFEGWRGEE